MKKILSLIVALTLCVTAAVSLSSCSGGKVNLKILDTTYTTEEYAICFAKNSPYKESVNNALKELLADGTVQKIIDKYISGVENDLVFQQNVPEDAETIIMATNAEFPPYEYHEGDQIVGIDAEIAAAIADKLGMKLEIQDMAFDVVINAVTSNKAQFGMAGLTVTEDRMKSVDFSDPYATGVQVVITREDSDFTVDDLTELKEDGSKWTIGVQTNTTGDLYATADLMEGDDATETAIVERYSKGADAVQALVSGKIDCVIIDNEPAKAFVEENNNK